MLFIRDVSHLPLINIANIFSQVVIFFFFLVGAAHTGPCGAGTGSLGGVSTTRSPTESFNFAYDGVISPCFVREFEFFKSVCLVL